MFEKDTAVTLLDGTTIYVDVYRPAGTGRFPVVVACSPYGKNGGTHPRNTNMFDVLGIDRNELSSLGKFEGPDPAFWLRERLRRLQRGVYHSGGDSIFPGQQDGQDCHDLIEWLAVGDWCTGTEGMAGSSLLTIAQWFTAAEQLPHLKAVAPWEGMSDIYRDLVVRGGMPDLAVPAMWAHSYAGTHEREDLVAEAQRLSTTAVPAHEQPVEIEGRAPARRPVPAYVVASYSNLIHTPGTFRAWREISSPDKWLRVHNTMEWPDFNDAAHKHDLLRFFDHYLKGEDNRWEDTPRVRYAVRDIEGRWGWHFIPANSSASSSADTTCWVEYNGQSLLVGALVDLTGGEPFGQQPARGGPRWGRRAVPATEVTDQDDRGQGGQPGEQHHAGGDEYKSPSAHTVSVPTPHRHRSSRVLAVGVWTVDSGAGEE